MLQAILINFCGKNSVNGETYETTLVSNIITRIHESQCTGLVVSPVSIISSIILYGRTSNGVCVGKIKELMEWLRREMLRSGYTVDWQGSLSFAKKRKKKKRSHEF